MKRTLLILLVAALAVVAAACGDDDTEATTPGAGSDPVPASECIGEGEELLPEYDGLSEDEATDLADEQGLDVREVGRDGECAVVTMDLRDDRVNLEFVDDVVIAAAIF